MAPSRVNQRTLRQRRQAALEHTSVWATLLGYRVEPPIVWFRKGGLYGKREASRPSLLGQDRRLEQMAVRTVHDEDFCPRCWLHFALRTSILPRSINIYMYIYKHVYSIVIFVNTLHSVNHRRSRDMKHIALSMEIFRYMSIWVVATVSYTCVHS